MADGASPLRGRRLLVVEDEYMIAADMTAALEDAGAEVVGPAGSVTQALELLATTPSIDAAVLDINLREERVFPVADTLRARAVPFVFTTGYDVSAIPADYAGEPRCEKPVDTAALARLLAVVWGEREAGQS